MRSPSSASKPHAFPSPRLSTKGSPGAAGGNFGLALDDALNLNTAQRARQSRSEKVKSALSMTQTAYRSLYWDAGKAALIDGAGGSGSAYQQAQLANYQAALDRLTSGG